MKKLFIIFAILASSGLLFAQNEVDGLRYSQLYNFGTARSSAMGGAFGALGGDFISLSTNPAGMGVYRHSELTFTPVINMNKVSADYYGSSASDARTNLAMSNLGVVFSFTSGDSQDEWKSVNFGFGYNRLADFYSRSTFEGVNNESSMLDYFLPKTEGKTYDEFDYFFEGLAWETFLIDYENFVEGQYASVLSNWSDSISPVYDLQQTKSTMGSGSVGEIPISLAANYMNKLYIGASLGIQSLKYNESYKYTESDIDNKNPYLDYYDFEQSTSTRGFGLNLKFGMIYRPIEWVRIGAAVHTPTFYELNYRYNSSIYAKFDTVIYDGSSAFSSESPEGEYDYTVTTPFRAIGSLAFIIKKMALLSIDYEFVDYSKIQLGSADAGTFNEANNAMQTNYIATSNLRAGLEYRYGPFSLRGGFAYFGNPYAGSAAQVDASRMLYSGGFGIRDNNLLFNLSYVYMQGKEKHYPYNVENIPNEGATMSLTNSQIMATFGVRF